MEKQWCAVRRDFCNVSFSAKPNPKRTPLSTDASIKPSRQELRKHCGGSADIAVKRRGNTIGVARFKCIENAPVLLVGSHVVVGAMEQMKIRTDLEPQAFDDAEHGPRIRGAIDYKVKIVIGA